MPDSSPVEINNSTSESLCVYIYMSALKEFSYQCLSVFAMASIAAFSSCFYLAIITLWVSTFTSTDATRSGFSVELIHRDSPKSPFYNDNETYSQRVRNAFHRSIARLSHFNPAASVSPQTAQSEVLPNGGEYIMRLSIGTPPFEILAIADTGSDLIWTQCKPCDDCYHQEAPLFDPPRSSTYTVLSCTTSQCQSLPRSFCLTGQICQYSYSYGDRSFTKGNLATDTITLGSTTGGSVSFPTIAIGCGHNNRGTFNAKGSGIVGLGGGSLSLVSQMGSSVGGKFSYCLLPFFSRTGNSKLNFGDSAEVSGPGVVSTPLLSQDPNTFYFLTLNALTIENTRIKLGDTTIGNGNANIIIDSGTTLTLLPQDVVSQLSSIVEKKVTGGEKVQDPSGFLSLCYKDSSDLKIPVITAQFTNADVQLNPINTFVKVADGVVCFAFAASPSVSIFGNVAQSNFLIGYDIAGGSLSFKPTDCSTA